VSAGADSKAAAYVETIDANGVTRWGVGVDVNILSASLQAVLSALNGRRAASVSLTS
jgi:2-isopropylmalate synthase